MSLSSLLPQPKNIYNNEEEHPLFQKENKIVDSIDKPKKIIPVYRKRKGYLPKTIEDFGDGGAFPEIHIVQYPLDMGRKVKSNKASGSNSSSNGSSSALVAVKLQVDSDGNARHEAILGSKAIIHSQYKDLVPKQYTENELSRPDDNEIQETLDRTKNALEKIVNGKIRSSKSTNLVDNPQNGATYIKYTPSNQSSSSSTQSRIIRMVDTVVDPLEPPKYKIKKKIMEHGSPPAPVMHSPPRKLTVQEQQDWNIPPCISNWKNPKGFAIAIDKRLASDGRGLQDVEINDKFAHFTQALYIAESNAREEVSARAELERKISQKEKERKQEMLRKLAEDVRNERSGILQQRNEKYNNRDGDNDSSGSDSDSESDSDDDRRRRRRKDSDSDNDYKRTTTTTTTTNSTKRNESRRRDNSDDNSDNNSDSDNDSRRDRRNRKRNDSSDSDNDSRRDRRDRRDDSRERINKYKSTKNKYSSSDSDSSDSENERERKEKRERDRIRMEKKRELEREYRLEASGKKSKLNRDQDRDISEKIALGQASHTRTEDSIYDQRLFNQSETLSSGFGADDSYNVYSKPLFGGAVSNSIYRPKNNQEDNTTIDDVLSKSRFGNNSTTSSRPHKEFSGTDRSKERNGPVAFEKEKKKSDPFGFDDFSKK